MKLRHMCHENHIGPPANVKIGTIAGWEAFGIFVFDGGYGESQATLSQIAALNETYQEEKYVPRQTEYEAITEWLNTTYEEDEEWLALRNAKSARRPEIHAEIDVEWTALADAIRDLISDENYNAFLDAHGLLP